MVPDLSGLLRDMSNHVRHPPSTSKVSSPKAGQPHERAALSNFASITQIRRIFLNLYYLHRAGKAILLPQQADSSGQASVQIEPTFVLRGCTRPSSAIETSPAIEAYMRLAILSTQ